MRGTVTVNEALCKGCGLCIDACPKGLLELAEDRFTPRGYHPVILRDPEAACTGCELCATLCPEAALTVYRARAAA